jgi:hypothetical protein
MDIYKIPAAQIRLFFRDFSQKTPNLRRRYYLKVITFSQVLLLPFSLRAFA